MIFDTLANCKLYNGINEDFQKAFDFLKKATEENLPVGKYEIDGSRVFAFVNEYTTKSQEEGKLEGHRNYIDIQYLVSGIETIEVVDISKVVLETDYDEANDLAFYENSDKVAKCTIEPGEYGILFPNDIHKPGLSFKDKPRFVKKIVVKVKV